MGPSSKPGLSSMPNAHDIVLLSETLYFFIHSSCKEFKQLLSSYLFLIFYINFGLLNDILEESWLFGTPLIKGQSIFVEVEPSKEAVISGGARNQFGNSIPVFRCLELI